MTVRQNRTGGGIRADPGIRYKMNQINLGVM